MALLGACASPEESFDESLAESARPDSLWPNGDVYLVKAFESRDLGRGFTESKAKIERETGIRIHLVADKSEVPGENWVTLRDSDGGGYAPLGISDPGEDAGSDRQSLEHELGHLFGLHHTQERVDRDDHITVHESHIEADHLYEFAKENSDVLIGPYRSDSVMHYASWMYSEDGCASLSLGTRDKDACVGREDEGYFPEANRELTDWNLSVLAALYCDERYCGNSCAPIERCTTSEVVENLERLYRWELTEEAREQGDRYDKNMEELRWWCQPTRREYPTKISDCDSDGLSLWGGASGAQVEYEIYGQDEESCRVDPAITIEGDVSACMYFDCDSGAASVSCPSGTTPKTLLRGDKEVQGCCGEKGFSVGLDCPGFDDSAKMYVGVHPTDDQGECNTYGLSLHF